MTRDVPRDESATLEEIFELLVSSSHKRVVIVDDKRHVAGIIADSDLNSESKPRELAGSDGSPGVQSSDRTNRWYSTQTYSKDSRALCQGTHDWGCDHCSRGDARRECLGAFGGKARKTITGGKRRRPAGWNC